MALHILFFQICVGIVALPIHILNFFSLWSPIVRKALPYLLERFTKTVNKQMGEHKRDLFRHLDDFRSPSGELKVLEIGCGTGANFEFFPARCKVTLVDPNPNFKNFLSKSLSDNEHVNFENFLVAGGEDMSLVASGSQDVVICTLVMCSVHNIDAVISEIKRVLRIGGGFFFIEHVLADPVCGLRPLVDTVDSPGTQNALLGAWPWQVSMQYYIGLPEYKHLCGASLVRNTWLLSAAHCYMEKRSFSSI